MRAKVTNQGVLVPKQWLEGIDEVEIRQEQTRIVIEPANMKDPILQLGTEPVIVDVDDASIHHIAISPHNDAGIRRYQLFARARTR